MKAGVSTLVSIGMVAATAAMTPPATAGGTVYRASLVCFDPPRSAPRLPQGPPMLMIHAVDAGGAILPDAEVTATLRDKPVLTGRVGQDGTSLFRDVAEGTLKLRISRQGFKPAEATIETRRGCLTAILAPLALEPSEPDVFIPPGAPR